MGNEKPIRVKVVHGREAWWYEKHVGEEFQVKVDEERPQYYYTMKPLLKGLLPFKHHIRKEDCKIIKSNAEK